MQNASLAQRAGLALLAVVAVIAALIWGLGWDQLVARKVDLLYLGQQHLFLVFWSMLFALLVGIPSGILLSRPFARRWAEYVMQIFNVGNTLPPLAVLALAMVIIGMTKWQRLRQVELPNALPVILAGVRIATAINVGTAPLAFLIGASSFGELIFPGIYLNDFPTLILGAVATALVALVLDMLLAALGRFLSPHAAA
jgi:osmoprotectant transport system permease protein